ncbi:MAG TPA: cation transporter, partial [Planctomycetota bacterium]|nr:cation transporter [Planctomycetota bacterium]
MTTEPERPLERQDFKVLGLDCAEEVLALRQALEPLDGVGELGFDLLSQRLTVRYDAGRIGVAALSTAIGRTGMRALPWTDAAAAEPRAGGRLSSRTALLLAGAAGLAAGFAWHVAQSGELLLALAGRSPPPASRALYLLAALAGLVPLLPKALAAARGLRPDMHLLMTLAIAGALVLGDRLEAATVAALFLLSLQLESWSLGRARRAVEALLDLSPQEAEVLHETGAQEAAADAAAADAAHRHGHRVPAAQVAVGIRGHGERNLCYDLPICLSVR